MKMRKYMVYVDDGEYLMKLAIPAKSVKAAKEYASGNGEIIKVSDVTEDYPIDSYKVAQALKNGNFGQTEIDFILRTLYTCNIAE